MTQPAQNIDEKEIRQYCKNFFSIISQYISQESFLAELKKIISNPEERQNFFQFLSSKKVPIDIQIKILNHPFAYRLANLNISQNLFSTKPPIKKAINYDNEKFADFIHKFLSIRGNPAVSSDFLRIIQNNNLMSDKDLKLFCDSINWVGEKYPKKVLRQLGLPASIGWMTKKSIASYTKVDFPIGYPKRSGQEKRHALLCNQDWVACECQSEDPHHHTAIIRQVNEMLEDIEDRHSYLDIQIERNMNVLVYFLTKGKKCTGFPSPMVLNEMNEIYKKGGAIILELYKKNPEKYQPIIVERLRQRGISLRTERINKLEHFATDLERVLPPQRSKYQSAQSIKNAFPNFSEVGKMPICYKTENINLIGQLVEIYIDIQLKNSNSELGTSNSGFGTSISSHSSTNLYNSGSSFGSSSDIKSIYSNSNTNSNDSLSNANESSTSTNDLNNSANNNFNPLSSAFNINNSYFTGGLGINPSCGNPALIFELEKMKQISRIIMNQLYYPPTTPLRASFTHTASLCTAAILTNELDVVNEIDDRTKTGVKVAVEIGITSEMLHGHWRLFKIAIDTLNKKKWTDGAREMSGIFFEINLTKAIRIIRTINLFIKCLKQEATNEYSENDPDLLLCNFTDNTIIISFAANPNFATALDLTRFET